LHPLISHILLLFFPSPPLSRSLSPPLSLLSFGEGFVFIYFSLSFLEKEKPTQKKGGFFLHFFGVVEA
jgi:hypothetical protein